jgi:hypothetical protein
MMRRLRSRCASRSLFPHQRVPRVSLSALCGRFQYIFSLPVATARRHTALFLPQQHRAHARHPDAHDQQQHEVVYEPERVEHEALAGPALLVHRQRVAWPSPNDRASLGRCRGCSRWHARCGPPSLGRSGESRCEKGPLHQKQTRSVSQCWMSCSVCVCWQSDFSPGRRCGNRTHARVRLWFVAANEWRRKHVFNHW